MNNTKGDISMNMIIMAIIALLVLAIVAYLIFNTGDKIQDGTSCTSLGGECTPTSCANNDDNPVRIPGADCSEGVVCCQGIGNN